MRRLPLLVLVEAPGLLPGVGEDLGLGNGFQQPDADDLEKIEMDCFMRRIMPYDLAIHNQAPADPVDASPQLIQ